MENLNDENLRDLFQLAYMASVRFPLSFITSLCPSCSLSPACTPSTCPSCRSLSFSEFYQHIHHLAQAFNRWKIQHFPHSHQDDSLTSRVALLASNNIDYLIHLFALPAAGLPIVPINTFWHAKEILYALKDSGASVLIYEDRFEDKVLTLRKIMAVNDIVYPLVFIPMNEFLNQQTDFHGRPSVPMAWTRLQPLHSTHPKEYGVFYTTGTTSTPKGARLSHFNLVFQATAKISHLHYAPQTVSYNIAPLYHVGGIASTIAQIMAGSTIILANKFQPHVALNVIRTFRVNTLVVVPAMLHDMISVVAADQEEHRSTAEPVLPQISTLLVGGNALTPSLLKSVQHLMPEAKIFQTYAMTECASTITFQHIQNSNHLNCFDRIPDHLSIAILQLDSPDLVFAHSGVQGEIIVRGSQLMISYCNQDIDNSPQFIDGWFRTGDLGAMDENSVLHLKGRVKDIIKSAGENVHAVEVEKVLAQYPKVLDAVVIGLPHPYYGEMVTAVVVPKPNEKIEQTHLDSFCRQHLTPFKVPKKFVVVNELPRSSMGKVLKHKLKEILNQSYQSNL